MTKHSEFINGMCQQMLFSPKGEVEGALVQMKGAVLQVSVRPDQGAALARQTAPGRRLRALAIYDHSLKTAQGAHPVYKHDRAGHADAGNAPRQSGGSGVKAT